MSGASNTVEDCGCCDGVSRETPAAISNRPGLTQIFYRVGTHSAFKASMIAALSDPDFPGAAPLTTRDDGDFSIALLDAWSVSADIITFYQERLANESYLRTAGQQRSVFELARLVGYQPSPGVAASTSLAYTLNDAPGAPDPVAIPAGSRAQSIPAPGQTAATFETSADFVARIEHNALQPQSALPVDFSKVTTSLWFSGTSTNLKPGDAILFVAEDRFGTPSSTAFALRIVTAVDVDAADKRTLVAWDRTLQRGNLKKTAPLISLSPLHLLQDTAVADREPRMFLTERSFAAEPPALFSSELEQLSGIAFASNSLSGMTRISDPIRAFDPFLSGTTTDPLPFTAASKVHAYTLRRKAALFGANAVDPALAPSGYSKNKGSGDWKWETGDGKAFYLDAAYQGIVATTDAAKAGKLDPAQFSWAALSVDGIDQVYRVDKVSEESPLRYMLSNKATKLALDSAIGLTRADTSGNVVAGTLVADTFVTATRRTSAFAQSELLDIPDQPILAVTNVLSFQDGMIAPVGRSTLALLGGARLAAKQSVAVSGKRLRLELLAGPATFTPSIAESAAIAPVAGDIFLLDAVPSAQSSNFAVLTLKGVAGTLNAAPSQLLLLPSDKSDPDAGELAVIDQVSPSGTLTALTFKAPLGRLYDRATVEVNANVVAATHGETVSEILGGGDATTPNQSFTLKQSPLTYVSTPQGQGAQSTLDVWVNDLKWHAAQSFLDSKASDRAYVMRQDNGGAVTVQFGDGINGARTPSGQINIRAKYRKGIGLSGMAVVGQISQAIDRPGGLRGVVNPQAATGGADPDGPDDARNSVPIHVRTLDRVVSLDDYENYARAFAGVAKASTSWAWFGHTRGVSVTVCGAGGSTLDPNSATIVNLAAALTGAGNPYVPLKVMPHRQALFSIGGKVRIDADRDTGQVMDNVRAALRDAFRFAARNLGQAVAQSEVVAVIQAVPGVVAVDLTRFSLNQTAMFSLGRTAVAARAFMPVDAGLIDSLLSLRLSGPLPEFLSASAPPSGRAPATPASLLLIDPASLDGLGVWL
jgi:hypothetical protein